VCVCVRVRLCLCGVVLYMLFGSRTAGLNMNYHTLAPKKYKRSVVAGLVHRIHRSCSTWLNFNESLVKAKTVWKITSNRHHSTSPLLPKL